MQMYSSNSLPNSLQYDVPPQTKQNDELNNQS